MATALTLWPLATHATLVTDKQRLLGTAQPATGATPVTTLTAQGLGDATRRTTAGFFLSLSWGHRGGSIGSGAAGRNGTGFIYTSAALNGKQFVAGAWTIKLRLKAIAAVTGHFRLRLAKWDKSSTTGVYTPFGGNITGVGSVTTGFQVFTFTPTLAASPTFNAGEVLYVTLLYNNTAAYPATPGTVTFFIRIGATCRIVTPGFQAPAGAAAIPQNMTDQDEEW